VRLFSLHGSGRNRAFENLLLAANTGLAAVSQSTDGSKRKRKHSATQKQHHHIVKSVTHVVFPFWLSVSTHSGYGTRIEIEQG
jgi:hypothetical protein